MWATKTLVLVLFVIAGSCVFLFTSENFKPVEHSSAVLIDSERRSLSEEKAKTSTTTAVAVVKPKSVMGMMGSEAALPIYATSVAHKAKHHKSNSSKSTNSSTIASEAKAPNISSSNRNQVSSKNDKRHPGEPRNTIPANAGLPLYRLVYDTNLKPPRTEESAVSPPSAITASAAASAAASISAEIPSAVSPAVIAAATATAVAAPSAKPAHEFKAKPEGPPLFYMYELPEEYWWRWPSEKATKEACLASGYVGHEHAELSGMGPPVLPENGLFLTWHFSLFSSLYNRYKRSKRRTMDPEKASMFIIPYDLGLDGYLNPDSCGNRRRCTRGLVQRLEKNLTESPYWQRYEGADHVVLWSLGQYHPYPHEWCDTFMMKFCAKCSFTCYWMDPTKKDNKFVSVPFPSAYHWHDGIKNLPWDLNLAANRTLHTVYLGSTQTLNPAHTKIRRAMTAQCNKSTECHWMQISHSSVDNSIADFLSIYKKSIFCLCPPGDDPARKAVSDAIISGCIPVIFEVATLYNQYPWHIGEQDALDISVSIPGGAVRSGQMEFMKVLLAIKPEVIAAKQRALARVAPRVQYAMPPLENLKDKYDATPWDPPFPDGAEIALDGLFARTQHIVNNQSTGIPHRLMTSREWSQEYDVVKVQVPKEKGDYSNSNGAVAQQPVDHSTAAENLFLSGAGDSDVRGGKATATAGGGGTLSAREAAIQRKRKQQERVKAAYGDHGGSAGADGGAGGSKRGRVAAAGAATESASLAEVETALAIGANAQAGPGEREHVK